ncbi:UDP-2,4-diacetamido-2,4,6-trideoxy-beta-L-altropyranose hydrolase [Paenibacillus tritici]|uniref:UDP-2,4-diacetamido-2,4, 6-trideoxy-beta-L-altropyranose hydrolase n=1 Tax=Paenibacillus tritici TaxID=1873425 RepID=UPI001BA6C353|nr:UDP-2,4-diacetamido-2,4,6-trideoxy-beta-L-altropyranose hydrolase [Paenibacillus tritici]QUL53556.1 UDP-2,4-diacetamido-2,4,6-trideoxy-beta-L-altropyranose hydrolase [Paenibacillus tritici]
MVTDAYPQVNLCFRVDSSHSMGTGHVMRCLTLANELARRGAKVSFICRDLPGNLAPYVMEQGYQVFMLPGPDDRAYAQTWLQVDWRTDALQTAELLREAGPVDGLIIDQYGIDQQWETLAGEHAGKIVVIDDLADRLHQCDMLLDPNLSADGHRYQGLVPNHCMQLLGTSYTLLRPEFRAVKPQLPERDGSINRILIFFGGTDPTRETIKTLHALQSSAFADLHLDVVAGGMNRNKDDIAALCRTMPKASFHCQIDYMAELMQKADLSIGAGGSTTWERCYLGLPSLSIITADNQREITTLVHEQGATRCLGSSADVTPLRIEQELKGLLADPSLVKGMSEQALQIMGEDKGNEVIDRIMGGDYGRHSRLYA